MMKSGFESRHSDAKAYLLISLPVFIFPVLPLPKPKSIYKFAIHIFFLGALVWCPHEWYILYTTNVTQI